jgi:hypothetical protein
MPSLADYPTLASLYHELQRLDSSERHRLRAGEIARQRAGEPPDVQKVSVPWWPRVLWCDAAQRAVLTVLTEALGSRVPDVPEGVLLRAAKHHGAPASLRKLAGLFEDSPARAAWGELVLPGKAPASYRLLPPPEAADDAPAVEAGEDVG